MIRQPPRSTLFPTRRSSDLRDPDARPLLRGVRAPRLEPAEGDRRGLRRALHPDVLGHRDRKSTRLNSSHTVISYAVFCLKKKKQKTQNNRQKVKYRLHRNRL